MPRLKVHDHVCCSRSPAELNSLRGRLFDRQSLNALIAPSNSRFFSSWMLAVVCLVMMGRQGYTEDSLRYQVTFANAQAHYIEVELELEPTEPGPVTLFLPVWTPGSYLVREYARHIDSVQALSSDGQALKIQKTSKNQWRVETDSSDTIQVRYRVYCNEMSVRTNFVDAEFAILNGAATFLTCRDRLTDEHQITLDFGDRWQQSVSAMRRSAGKPHSFVAPNYDELVDSPILIGSPEIYPFEAGGITHFLVNQGGDHLWNGERAATDVAKIVAEHQRMWGVVPYDRYYFLNLISESGGGLEHDNSTLLMTSRWSFSSPRSYRRWLGLVSHEFFHAWNVRRLRPAALINYDYLGENYFDELWVAEGVTSYYDELAVARCGLTSQQEYLSGLSSTIAGLQSTPGRKKQSLVESSHDTWIKFYRPNENSRNTSISYYSKGAIVAFLLDIEIRRATDNERSLDDVMRLLYQRFAPDKGYTNKDVRNIASEVAGVDLNDWFEQAVNSTSELDYWPALKWLGLQFRGRPSPSADGPAADKQESGDTPSRQSADSNAEDREEPREPAGSSSMTEVEKNGSPWIGVSSSSAGGRLEITRVVEGSPAFAAGLNVGDEMLAIGEYRLTGSLDRRLEQYAVGDTVHVLISRRGKLRSVPVTIGDDPNETWRLEVVAEPSELQRVSLAAWLRQPLEQRSVDKSPTTSSQDGK